MAAPHESIVLDYARDTVDSPDACLDTQAAARRYLADLRNPMWNFRTGMAETIIEIIESLFCHQQGEDLLGRPLRGKPLILEPFQLFVIYNVCGFFYPAPTSGASRKCLRCWRGRTERRPSPHLLLGGWPLVRPFLQQDQNRVRLYEAEHGGLRFSSL